jgi:hypothetical protein
MFSAFQGRPCLRYDDQVILSYMNAASKRVSALRERRDPSRPRRSRRNAEAEERGTPSMTDEGGAALTGASLAGSAVFPHGSLFFPKFCGCHMVFDRRRRRVKRAPLTVAKLRKFMLP